MMMRTFSDHAAHVDYGVVLIVPVVVGHIVTRVKWPPRYAVGEVAVSTKEFGQLVVQGRGQTAVGLVRFFTAQTFSRYQSIGILRERLLHLFTPGHDHGP